MAAPAPNPELTDKDKLTVYLVSGGDDFNSFYNSLYGALKYYMKKNGDKIISENLLAKLGTIDAEKSDWVEAFREDLSKKIQGGAEESIFFTMKENDKNPRPYEVFAESFRNKIKRGTKFKEWLEAAPEKVQNEFGPAFDVYQSRFFKEFFSAGGKPEVAEKLFYKKLGGIISGNVPSFESDISVCKYILLMVLEVMLNTDSSETQIPSTALMINEPETIFISKLDSGGYGFFTLNPNVLEEEKDNIIGSYEIYTKTGVKDKNVPRFITIDNQTIDTVDYYQLGINRYGQLSKKYDFEQSLYEKQRYVDADTNVETIARNQAGLVTYQYESELFDMTLRNYSMYTMLMDENMKGIDNIVKLTQQLYDRMVEFLTENFRLLAQDEIITVQSLLTTFREMNSELTHTIEKNNLSSDLRKIELHLSTLTQLTELQNKIKMNIHDFSTRTTVQLSALNREIVSNTGIIFETMAGVKMNGVNFEKGMESILQKVTAMQSELKDSLLNPGEVEYLRGRFSHEGMAAARIKGTAVTAGSAAAGSAAAAAAAAAAVAVAGSAAAGGGAIPPVLQQQQPTLPPQFQGFVGNLLPQLPVGYQQAALAPGVGHGNFFSNAFNYLPSNFGANQGTTAVTGYGVVPKWQLPNTFNGTPAAPVFQVPQFQGPKQSRKRR